jgi:hypothetical protein
MPTRILSHFCQITENHEVTGYPRFLSNQAFAPHVNGPDSCLFLALVQSAGVNAVGAMLRRAN